jgi:hypothetical protein
VIRRADITQLATELVIYRIVRRLAEQGCATEIEIISRLSAQEMDELVWQERHA